MTYDSWKTRSDRDEADMLNPQMPEEEETELEKVYEALKREHRRRTTIAERTEELYAALSRLTNAKALAGVRSLVAGWNGENLPEPHKKRHPSHLGARIETNCGAIYELDEALSHARAVLSGHASQSEPEPPSEIVTDIPF